MMRPVTTQERSGVMRGSTLTRVSCIILLPSGNGRNCLGNCGVLRGHSRVPLPPAKMTACKCSIRIYLTSYVLPRNCIVVRSLQLMQGLYRYRRILSIACNECGANISATLRQVTHVSSSPVQMLGNISDHNAWMGEQRCLEPERRLIVQRKFPPVRDHVFRQYHGERIFWI